IRSSGAIALTFSPDGKTLATTDRILRLWNVHTGRLSHAFEVKSQAIRSMAFSPDGRMIAAGCSDAVVRLVETSTGKERLAFRGHHTFYANANSDHIPVALSPDGNTVASGTRPGIVLLWD